MCNGRHRYFIDNIPGEMPKWLSYSGEGCSLSFHIPPVFQGLVLWFVCPLGKDDHYYSRSDTTIIIIRNKSNGIQLFENKISNCIAAWIRYISRSEMAMEDYCGDDELELHIYSKPIEKLMALAIRSESGWKSDFLIESLLGRDKFYSDKVRPYCGIVKAGTPEEWSDYLYSTELTGRIEECGVHVIAEKLDSFEKSEVGKDTLISSSPLYHLLSHPHCDSITASTPKQWSDYLFAKLHKYNLHLRLLGKNAYFL